MPPLLYPLPTTSQVTFSSLFLDPSSSFGSALAEATAARTKLHLALKALDEKQPGASAVSVIDAVQTYLPYLRGIAECLDADQLLWKGEPTFLWRAPLTHYPLNPPLLPMPSIQAEQLMVMFSYILALSNYAYSILESLPSFEPSPGTLSKAHMTAEDEKRTAAGLARAVELLCQASGIAKWTADELCPKLDGVKKAMGRLGKYKWPIEASEDACRGLSMVLLADAHLTAIRKLLLPVLPHVIFSPPGPPLPSNHPSPSLLAKLYLHVASLYDSARALLNVQPQETSSRKLFSKSKDDGVDDSVEGDIIPLFKRYLRKESILASGLARKWLGVDAGENGKGAKTGEAVAWMKDAQVRLEELEGNAMREKMKGLSFGKDKERKRDERMARKGRLERELEVVAAWLRSYQRMNDTVLFQPVPPSSSLTIPAGRPIFTEKSFVQPPSKLKVSRTFLQEDGVGDKPEDEGSSEDYAGKGNYF